MTFGGRQPSVEDNLAVGHNSGNQPAMTLVAIISWCQTNIEIIWIYYWIKVQTTVVEYVTNIYGKNIKNLGVPSFFISLSLDLKMSYSI